MHTIQHSLPNEHDPRSHSHYLLVQQIPSRTTLLNFRYVILSKAYVSYVLSSMAQTFNSIHLTKHNVSRISTLTTLSDPTHSMFWSLLMFYTVETQRLMCTSFMSRHSSINHLTKISILTALLIPTRSIFRFETSTTATIIAHSTTRARLPIIMNKVNKE